MIVDVYCVLYRISSQLLNGFGAQGRGEVESKLLNLIGNTTKLH
jgi:hypothetical protein